MHCVLYTYQVVQFAFFLFKKTVIRRCKILYISLFLVLFPGYMEAEIVFKSQYNNQHLRELSVECLDLFLHEAHQSIFLEFITFISSGSQGSFLIYNCFLANAAGKVLFGLSSSRILRSRLIYQLLFFRLEVH